MLLIKFITISLCCKLYVRNESLDLQNIIVAPDIAAALKIFWIVKKEQISGILFF